jgi:DNA ligase (NAD+)
LETINSFAIIDSAATECNTMEDVLNFINKWDYERKNFDFVLDGVVVKANSLKQHAILGQTGK